MHVSEFHKVDVGPHIDDFERIYVQIYVHPFVSITFLLDLSKITAISNFVR